MSVDTAARNQPVLFSPKAFAQSRGRSRSVGSGNGLSHTTPPKPLSPRGRPSAAAFTTKKGKAGGGKGSWGRYDWAARKNIQDLQVNANMETDDQEEEDVVMVEATWTITASELRSFIEPKLLQFLNSSDIDDITTPLAELGRPDLNPNIVEVLIIEGIERSDPDRELISDLLTKLFAEGLLSMADVEAGFDRVLPQLDDLNLDTPNAHQVAGKFMARAVADEIMAPRFISSRPGPQDSDYAALAFNKARGLIVSPQGFGHLAHVWGSSGARSPVDELRSKVSLMLGEYLLTNDLMEAEACARELRAKHFMHEVVFQAIDLAIDGRSERDMRMLSTLLLSLCNSSVISSAQLESGLDRVLQSIDDLQLDIPKATLDLDTFCRLSSSFLPREFCAKVAQLACKAMKQLRGGRVRSITLPNA
eukprot:m.17115 g.17115  ORF g.17115 m.17115 type:complete len:420 (+) comp3457_c0_seq1:1349-2608(+)